MVSSSCIISVSSVSYFKLEHLLQFLGVPFTNCLNNWKFTLLKFRVLTLLARIRQDCEFHQGVIPAAHAATSLDHCN